MKNALGIREIKVMSLLGAKVLYICSRTQRTPAIADISRMKENAKKKNRERIENGSHTRPFALAKKS